MQVDEPGKGTNRKVSRTVMSYEILHPAALDPGAMSAVDVANHLQGGEFVGRRTAIETNPVEDGAVDEAVKDMGGVEGFFREDGASPFGGSGS